jgi:hypothetical protein
MRLKLISVLLKLISALSMTRLHKKLLGESLREIGVLVFVFVPLDLILEGKPQAPLPHPEWMFWLDWLSLEHWVVVFFAVAGVFLLYFGIKIEAEASEEEDKDAVHNSGV